MKWSISRKIQLENYGGKKYEPAEITIHEVDTIAEAQQKLEEAVVAYIKHIPQEAARYAQAAKEATDTLPPF